MQLTEAFEKSLSDRAKRDLLILTHKKADLFYPGTKNRSVDEALKVLGQPIDFPVYRGIYDKEVKRDKPKVGVVLTLDTYTSFSESYELAKQFANKKNTKHIIYECKAIDNAFKYWEWCAAYYKRLKKLDKEEYDMVEGDYVISELEREKEWIVDMGVKFKIVGERKLAGNIIFTLTQI